MNCLKSEHEFLSLRMNTNTYHITSPSACIVERERGSFSNKLLIYLYSLVRKALIKVCEHFWAYILVYKIIEGNVCMCCCCRWILLFSSFCEEADKEKKDKHNIFFFKALLLFQTKSLIYSYSTLLVIILIPFSFA